jgi:serine/threonine protein kinase
MVPPTFTECPTCGLPVPQGIEKCPKDGTVLGDGAPTRGELAPMPLAMTQPAIGRRPLEANPTPPRAPLTDPLIGMQLGEYTIQEQIGIGGMGIVYRGEQPLIGKQVAIKVLRPEVGDQSLYVERLLAEARAVNAIRHRGIIDIFSFGKMPDGRQYFVMEYLEGTPLDVWLAGRGTLPVQDAIRLADELLDALTAAHRAGVIHRDLKPSNVFLARQPGGGSYVKVLDFGLAKQMSGDQALSQQTLHGMIIGTPEYMAPEQVRGDPVSPKTDLYAFGIILFQLLTGQLPFTARVAAEYLVHHLEHTPPSPLTLRPELPPALDRLVLKLLEKAPQARPTAEEVRAVLQELADGLPPPNGARSSRETRGLALPQQKAPAVSTSSPGTPLRFRTALVGGVAAGLLLLTSGVAMLMLRRPAPEPVAAPTVAPVTELPAKPPAAEPAPEPAPAATPDTTPVVTQAVVPTTSASGPSKVATERKSPLLTRIESLEQKLRASSLPADEKESAHTLLKKVRARAESASTSEERKQVQRNLDIWERQYLRN